MNRNVVFPVSAFQIRTDLSSDPLMSRRPSGLKPTLVTGPSCPLSLRIGCPVAVSHKMSIQTVPPDTKNSPLGLNAMLVTRAVCPSMDRTSLAVKLSHSFTDLSALAEASRRSSGLNSTAVTAPVWPRSRDSSP